MSVITNAEISVTGGMIRGPEMIPAVLAIVRESDFTMDPLRRVFAAMVTLWEDETPVTSVTVAARLKDRGDLEAAGGVDIADELLEQVPSAANIEYHARIIAKNGARRRLRETGAAITALVESAAGTASPEELQAEAERLLADAAPMVAGTGLVRVRDLLPDLLVHLEDITSKKAPTGVRTGLQAVDEKLGPMDKGALILVAGRPSMGKSAFGVCNIAADAAMRQGKVTVVFSVETDERGVMKRILGSEARANMALARRRKDFRDEEYARIASISGRMKDVPMWIDHAAGLTVDQLRVKLRRAAYETGPVEVVIVDYLQMMTDPKAKSRYEEVSNIGAALKRVATEFDTVVVALAQLSRAVEARPDKRPMMSDLRESGTLEQDADVVMLLYRPEYYHGPTMKMGRGKDVTEVNIEGKAEIIIAKVRDGETGAAVVGFEKEYTHFFDLQSR